MGAIKVADISAIKYGSVEPITMYFGGTKVCEQPSVTAVPFLRAEGDWTQIGNTFTCNEITEREGSSFLEVHFSNMGGKTIEVTYSAYMDSNYDMFSIYELDSETSVVESIYDMDDYWNPKEGSRSFTIVDNGKHVLRFSVSLYTVWSSSNNIVITLPLEMFGEESWLTVDGEYFDEYETTTDGFYRNRYSKERQFMGNQPTDKFRKGNLISSELVEVGIRASAYQDMPGNITIDGIRYGHAAPWMNDNNAHILEITGNCEILKPIKVSSLYMADSVSLEGLDFVDTSCATKIRIHSNASELDVSHFDTSNVTDLSDCFYNCAYLSTLNLGNWNDKNVTDMSGMFYNCSSLTSLDVSGFDYVGKKHMMFHGCASLTHIKCKQAFKELSIYEQKAIELPEAMREGGSGTWEIVD